MSNSKSLNAFKKNSTGMTGSITLAVIINFCQIVPEDAKTCVVLHLYLIFGIGFSEERMSSLIVQFSALRI